MPEVTDPALLGALNGGQAPRGRVYDMRDPAEEARKADAEARARAAEARANAAAGRDAVSLGNTIDNTKFDNISTLRSAYDGQQVVKQYRTILPQLMAGLTSAPNPQGDLALIYAFAKTMDPDSAVREQESATAADTAGFWAAKVEALKKNLGYDDARGLPAEAARGLRLEMNRKVADIAKAYGVQRARFQADAKAAGIDPERVVGPMEATPYLAKYKQAMDGLLGKTDPKKNIPGLSTGGTYSTPEDLRAAKVINGAFKRGATFEELQQMAADAGLPPLGDEHRSNVELRDSGKPVNEFLPGESGQTSDFMSTMGEFGETPAGTAAFSSANAFLGGIPQLMTGDAPMEAMRDKNWKSAMAGDITGGLASTALGAGGLMKAGLSAPRAATAANLGYGGMFGATTDEDNRLKGAGMGAGAALAGDSLGKYAIAPGLRAFADTPAGKYIASLAGKSVPRPISAGEQAVGSEVTPRVDAIVSALQEAGSMGLPMSPADVDPGLRQTLGSASRFSPNVRADVGRQLQDRSLAQADRALAGVNTSLAPPVSMSATSDAIRTAARTKAGPLYDQAFQMPAISSPAIDEILNTPSGQKAARTAYDIALDRGKSPAEIALALNPDGSVRIDANPTYETLDFVKKGFDQTLGAHRNPMTGKLDLEGNPTAQSIEGLRQRLVGEMDAGNPVYKDARTTYADAIKPRTSLQSGYDAAAPNVTQDQFGQVINRLGAPEMDTFRSGFSTSLADRINKARMSANPYDIVAGTPDQQAKLTALYPDAPAFLRQRELEQQMAQTAQEVLGGSPTQTRALADQRFAGPDTGDMAEIGASAITGMPPMGLMARMAKNPIKGMLADRAEKRAAQQAESAAPYLFNTDPTGAAASLQSLIDEIMARNAFKGRTQAVGGLLAAPVAAAGAQNF